MRRVWLAIKAFFLILFSGEVARRAEPLLLGIEPDKPSQTPTAPDKPKAPPAPPKPLRSEALTLLAALQREARFVDFLKEPLDGFTDAQVGAAARSVHRDCALVIERMFALEPATRDTEGSAITVPAGFDPQRFRLVGNVTGAPPFQGTLAHPGWQATRCDVPAWSGSGEAARIVAPAEVELA
ncbi:MAG: DUF2760 domain-containing protein [Planctomycetota bacterium]